MVSAFPDKIPSSVGRQRITVPKGFYEGHPDQFDFALQKKNYAKLKEALAQFDVELTLMSARPRHFDGINHTTSQMSFIVIAGDPKAPDFIWWKYESNNPRGAQNRVYVYGQQLRLTQFLNSDPFYRALWMSDTKRKTA